ncbi:MAG: PepSY domain-containing protein [Acidobacteria bacterium]|nr:PepSY domain-containing protein [Acidobacteriota bacterium]MBM3787688.1 PepSY domain-containing protein [Acidobacteriota bacterium]
MGFINKPREVFWRRALFQIHLWTGIVAGLYFLLIGVSGSLIVFKKELERAAIPHLIAVEAKPTKVSFQSMYDGVHAAYPKASISNVFLYPEGTSWSFRLSENKERVQVYVDPYTGRILGEDRYGGKLLQLVYDFHVDLLAGNTGELLNGIGGFLLVAMAVSGLVVWWPGLRNWLTGFRYATGASWKRQNYDIHKIGGLATVPFLFLLGLTGSYWTWPKEYEATLAWLTQGPAKTVSPVVPKTPKEQWKSLDEILTAARAAMPEGQPTLFRLAARPGDTHGLKRFLPGDWRTQGDDTVYLDPATAKVVRMDFHAEQPLGVRLQRDIFGLHFGMFGGMPTRVLWLFIGLSPLVLFVTGLLMYWNRVLVKKRASWNRPQAVRFGVSPQSQTGD